MHIVFNLVTQKLGGEIRVESEFGIGTRVLIHLPHHIEEILDSP
jgi:signal transduction histidine kinase